MDVVQEGKEIAALAKIEMGSALQEFAWKVEELLRTQGLSAIK